MSADFEAQLWLSTMPQSTDPQHLFMIANKSRYGDFRNFFIDGEVNQTSNPILLEAGNYYYMEFFHNSKSYSDHGTVGVTILSPNQLLNSVSTVQKISAKAEVKNGIPVVGWMTIVLNGNSTNIPADYADWKLALLLESYPGINQPVIVHQYGNPTEGSTWIIDFSGNPGEEITLIQLHNNNATGGSTGNVIFQSEVIRNGASDMFLTPISQNYLFTANDIPQITVAVNGIVANCPNFNCEYTILPDSKIPLINSFSVSEASVLIQLSQVKGFQQSDFKVTYGSSMCTNLIFTPENGLISCTLPVVNDIPQIVSGDLIPRVHAINIGFAIVDPSVTPQQVLPAVTNVSPNSGSTAGGFSITIIGTGFGLSLDQPSDTAVMLGNSPCQIISLSNTQIICVTNPKTTDSTLEITVNEKIYQNTSVFSYDDTNAPTISAISPSSASPVLYTSIKINGNNFGSDKSSIFVKLVSTNVPNKNYDCYVNNVNNTQINCTSTGGNIGTYKLIVKSQVNGYSVDSVDEASTFSFELYVTSITPTSGSWGGGTLITITGHNFSPNQGENQVTIGEISNIRCNVVNFSSNQLQCITEENIPQLTGPQSIAVMSRIVELASCQGACSFSFDLSSTPMITSMTPMEGIIGTLITFSGSNLDTNLIPAVTIGTDSCTIQNANATEITCLVTTTIAMDDMPIIINIPNKGNAQFTIPITFNSSLIISSVTPNLISQVGALFTIYGYGFDSTTTINIGTIPCKVIVQTPTNINCNLIGITLTYPAILQAIQGSLNTSYTNSYISSSAIMTPTVVSLSTNSISEGELFSLSVTGTGFILDSAISLIILILQSDPNILFVGSTSSTTSTSITGSFNNVPAGNYTLQVLINTAGYAKLKTGVNPNVTVGLTATTTAVTGSFAGGFPIIITGKGFYDSSSMDFNKISICGFPCLVTSSDPTLITCTAPALITAASQTQYGLVQPSILSGQWTADMEINSQILTDNIFSTGYKSINTNCFIVIDFGEGLNGQLQRLKYFPAVIADSTKFIGSLFEGSNDNITYVSILTLDATTHDDWNIWTPGSQTPYPTFRYIRYREGTSNSNCSLAEIQFYGIIVYGIDGTTTCDVKINIGGQTQTVPNMVTYDSTLTPTLNTISPPHGTAGGGTNVTLIGTGFGISSSDIIVTIDTVPCIILNVIDTQIECTTGPALSRDQRANSLYSMLNINIIGKGDAATN